MNGPKRAIFSVILLLVIGLSFQSYAFAQEKVSLQDKIIGSTFKTLARGFVAVVDINKFKRDSIKLINKKRPEKYKKEYAKVYEVLNELPPELKTKYGIVENMSKEQVIKNIESLDKKKAYVLIDSVPNAIIAKEFKKYLREKKQEVQESNLVKEINKFWNKAVAKVHEQGL
jgi:hypothetical protein